MEPRDAAAVARVHIRSWQVGYRGQLPDSLLDGLSAEIDQRTADWERAIAEAPSRGARLLVADQARRVTGFVTFGPAREEPGVGQVYTIFVDPRRWHGGHGRALLAAAIRGLSEAGYPQATLWVVVTNTRARHFYERAGWVADGAEQTQSRHDVTFRAMRYRLVLGSPC